jgi:hypothetical protein
MPKGGSVNQIDPSNLQTMSFGELSGLPSKRSASTVIELFPTSAKRRIQISSVCSLDFVAPFLRSVTSGQVLCPQTAV